MALPIENKNPTIETEGQNVESMGSEKYITALKNVEKSIQERLQPRTNYFDIASAFLKPTRTGSFGESLGNAAEVMGKNTALQREQELPLAKMRAELAQSTLLAEYDDKDRKLLANLTGFNEVENRVSNSLQRGEPPSMNDLSFLMRVSSMMTPNTAASKRLDKIISNSKDYADLDIKSKNYQLDLDRHAEEYKAKFKVYPPYYTPPNSKSSESPVNKPVSAPVVEPSNSLNLSTFKNAIISQESGGNQFDKNGNVLSSSAGALGLGQIMPVTWNGYVRKGIIPKEWSINDPDQNRKASGLIIDDIAKTYGSDPAKIAAVYFAGPNAINKDGSINYDLKDSDGTTVKKYVNSLLSRLGSAEKTKIKIEGSKPQEVQVASTNKYSNLPLVEQIKQESADIDTERELEKQRALKKMESQEKRISELPEALVAAQNKFSIGEQLNTAILGNEKAFGLLRQDPNLSKAVANFLESGIKFGNFQAGIKIEEALRKGLSPEQQQAVQLVESLLSQITIETASKMKGSVSNYEDQMVQRVFGSPSNTAGFLKYISNRQMIEGKYEQDTIKNYIKYNKENPKGSYSDYITSPEALKARRNYENAVNHVAKVSAEKMGIK